MFSRLRGLFETKEADSDMDEEMRAHLSLLTDRYVRQGMAPEDAAAAARRRFGNTLRLHEERRRLRTLPWIETVWRDLRYSMRQLAASPAFTVVAVLSLALGIGANTAVFTLLDQLVLRMLPVKDPERLVMIWPGPPHVGNVSGQRTVSYPLYQDFQRQSKVFESVFCSYTTPVAIAIKGSTERAKAEFVSGNYFQALGVGAAVGRVFSPEADDRVYAGHPVVVLSHEYWVKRFGGDPGVIGRKILINTYPMEIVGVSAPSFPGLDPSRSPHIRVPVLVKPLLIREGDNLANRRSQWLQLFGRLKPGYTAASAHAALLPLFRQIIRQEADEPPLNRIPTEIRELFLRRSLQVAPAATGYSELRQHYSTALIVLMGMAGLILLVACSNVANLQLARGAARHREIAVRVALGATRGRLLANMLLESVLLSIVGAALGVLLSSIATRGLVNMLPSNGTMLLLRTTPDLRILLIGTGAALATGIVFGILPALEATRIGPWTRLKDSASSTTGAAGSVRIRKVLVTAQVALSFLLLVGAGLFAGTLTSLKHTHTGFGELGNLVTFQVDPSMSGYTASRLHRFYAEVVERIRPVPGVSAASYAMVPLLNGDTWSMSISLEQPDAGGSIDAQCNFNRVSPGYFQSMGVPILAGRDFTGRDSYNLERDHKRGNPSVAIVNRKFAERFFAGRNPVGRRIGFGLGPGVTHDIEIVGVVEDTLYEGPRSGLHPQVVFPLLQSGGLDQASFYVRTANNPEAMFPVLRRVVAAIDSSIPVHEMRTLEMQLDETLSTERLIASLATVFAALASVLAALGFYGVMSYNVVRRTREIGLRMALGAPRGDVIWMVLREALWLLALGLIVGVPCAYLMARCTSSLLFGVPPTALWVYAGALIYLGFVAVAASILPARRASGIDPLTALRHE